MTNEPVHYNRTAVERRIQTVRSQKVILDSDLARIYGVATKVLNQAVKRNADRFPSDFMFTLTDAEKGEVVTNCDHLVIYAKIRPLLLPPPDPPGRRIGFSVRESRARYRVRRKM